LSEIKKVTGSRDDKGEGGVYLNNRCRMFQSITVPESGGRFLACGVVI
jgi:hypothetical protein